MSLTNAVIMKMVQETTYRENSCSLINEKPLVCDQILLISKLTESC